MSSNPTLSFCLTSILFCSGLVACTHRQPKPVQANIPHRLPVPVVRPIEDSVSTSARQIFAPGNLRYDLQTKVSLEPVAGDSVHRTDSTQITAVLAAEFTQLPSRDQIQVVVQVDSVAVRSIDNSPTQLPSGQFRFQINKTTGQIVQKEPNDSCVDTTTMPFTYGSEILPMVNLSGRQTWSDDFETRICRGAVGIILRHKATYTTLSESQVESRIVRTTLLTMTGSGDQWGQKVSVTGHGTATDTLLLSNSRLQRLTGISQLEIDFHSPLRQQRYVQTTATVIVLRH